MHCASCAAVIEDKFEKVSGIKSAKVNYGTESAKIEFNEHDNYINKAQELSKEIEPLGYSLIIPKPEKVSHHSMAGMNKENGQMEHDHSGRGEAKEEKLKNIAKLRSQIITMIPITLISIFVMSWDILSEFGIIPEMEKFWEEFFHHLMPIFATYALFFVGKPYLRGIWRFIKFKKADMDTLVGIGTLTAFLFSFVLSAFEESLEPYLDVTQSYYDVTIIVIAFISFGKFLELNSKLKTGDAIEKLLNLQAKNATVIRNNEEVEVALEEVKHGETVIVKPGGKIPVDGIILDGFSYIDESMVTGEPLAVKKIEGDTVIAGTINTTGTFAFKATKVGSETLIAHIIKMVEEAQGSKAPIEALVDKIAAIFVPAVLLLSVAALLLWLTVGSSYLGFSEAFPYGIVSFVTILIIACPCALGLATPTAIIVGVGKGAGEGILIKDAASLQKLHKVTALVVDKTGTITKGKPEIVSNNLGKNFEILYSLESKSEHPLAHAITSYGIEKKLKKLPVSDFEVIKGKGLKGKINGEWFFAGNTRLIDELFSKKKSAGTKVVFDKTTIEEATLQGKTPIILANEEKILGTVMVADAVKDNAKEAIADLHKLGIKVIMATGDNSNTAKYIADLVGIDEVIAEVLPAQKLEKIKELQKAGEIVAMAGDGINDSPALAQADVGIAMSTGTDVAIETAEITLLKGDISKIKKAIKISKITMNGIKQNLFWAFAYNVVGIPLAGGAFFPLFGWLLNPVFAGLAMGLSSVSVVGNSLRIKRKKL